MKLGKWLPWLLVFILAGALLFKFSPREPATLASAASSNRVSVNLAAVDQRNVTVTVSRTPDSSGEMSLLLPAGTIIHNADANSQRLMTATTVAMALSDDMPTASVNVEVYCLDQFALTPTAQSSLSLSTQGDSSEVEETEPVRKLAQCMENTSINQKARQLAVWFVAGGYVDHDYQAVRDTLVGAYRKTLMEQSSEKLDGLREKLQRDMPGTPQAQIDAAVERYRAGKLQSEVSEVADAQADRDLDGFKNEAFPALQQCDPETAKLPFFNSAAKVESVN